MPYFFLSLSISNTVVFEMTLMGTKEAYMQLPVLGLPLPKAFKQIL
jgi:hypothetical protein